MKTSENLWQCYKDEPTLNNYDAIIDFGGNNSNVSFKFKQKITDETGNDGTKNFK